MGELKSAAILSALHAAIDGTGGLTIQRNAILGEMVSGVFARLDDGSSEVTDTMLNPRMYEFTASPALMIVVEEPEDGIDATPLLNARLEAVATVLDGIMAAGALGGLITDLRLSPPDYAPKELFGAPNRRGAEIIIELDYWSTSRLG